VAAVVIQQVTKVFRGAPGEAIRAVHHVSLAVEHRELLVLVGPSGFGKTTLLRLIAGLEEPDEGTISFDGKVMNRVPPRDRDVALVFQNQALYPHMTAGENLAFSLKLRAVPRAEIPQRVAEVSGLLGVADCLGRRPAELSGGQRQRIALGRAVIRRPQLLLLDEPLSNLDAPLRAQMRAELLRLHARLSLTTLLVTHDQAEALALGQRLAVLKAGAVQQVGQPRSVYDRPANLFVAGFMGSPPMNFMHGAFASEADGLFFRDGRTDAGGTVRLRLAGDLAARLRAFAARPVILGLRPEALALRADDVAPAEQWRLDALVESVEPAGHETLLRLKRGPASLVARVPAHAAPSAGVQTAVFVAPQAARFFDAASGKAIG
jgi:multiple sugar transport system ATP-binding protein